MISATGELHFVDEEGGESEPPTPVQGAAVDEIEKSTTFSKLVLTPDEQFICEKCGKICKSKAGLLAHQRIAIAQKEG